jgi:glycosyltransferase involved in cell wall biosynthesis
MRVTLLIDHLGCGGAQRQLATLAVLLKRRGFDPQVLTYFDASFFRSLLEPEGIPLRTVSTRSRVGRIMGIRRELHAGRPDAVIAFLNTPNLLAELSGLPRRRFFLVVSERSYDGAEKSSRLRWYNYLRYRMHLLADAVVTNSRSQGDFVIRSVPKLASRTHVITNCVDLDYFGIGREPAAGFRSCETARIVVAANFGHLKNSLRLAQALKIAGDRCPSLSLTIDWYGNNFFQGDQPTRASEPYLRTVDFVKQHGLRDRFRTHPPVSDVRALYHSHDAFCLPSIVEGFPNAIGEAMACGLPVLAGCISDNASLVHAGENGLLFNPYDTESIATSLLQFARLTRDAVLTMGRTSRRLAEKILLPERVVDQYAELLRNGCRTPVALSNQMRAA